MTGFWPGKTRCTVMLTFDIDGPSAMINRNPRVEFMPSARSLGEFGPTVAMPRILAMLREFDIKATFYVPGWVAELNPEIVAQAAAEGHEIGHHGYLHEPPASLSPEAEAEVLERGSAILKGITGLDVEGYRSPAWELSQHSLRLLKERGFVYDSSLMGDDLPYWVDAGDGSLVEIPVHWSLDDAPYWSFNPAVDNRMLQASPGMVFDAWSAAFDELYDRGRAFVLTCHPWVIGRAGRLAMLQRLVERIRERRGVAFERVIDVAHEFAAR